MAFEFSEVFLTPLECTDARLIMPVLAELQKSIEIVDMVLHPCILGNTLLMTVFTETKMLSHRIPEFIELYQEFTSTPRTTKPYLLES